MEDEVKETENTGEGGEPVFIETQRFRQKWVWALVLPISTGLVVMFAYGMYVQLIRGEQWGGRPLPDAALAIVGTLMILLGVALTYLLLSLRLVTRVWADRVELDFKPLSSKTLDFSSIAECAPRSYRPILEYGGWGIKYGRGGLAYNVIGNTGVQLVMKNGSRLLIGTQRPDELASVIRSGMEGVVQETAANDEPGMIK